MFPILGQAPAIETFVHHGAFKSLPSIYAIEVTAACDLACPMCLRSQSVNKAPRLLQLELLKKMHDRGDFEGSYYIELQMSGEPTIHPKLAEIIDFLQYRVGVMVGLSTHGLNMKRARPKIESVPYITMADTLLDLDTLTISVDSIDPETYHKMRYPSTLPRLMENLEHFFERCYVHKMESHKLR
jgi:MoaA/NifB/PqqE/SkfB family radical SAM enzyme